MSKSGFFAAVTTVAIMGLAVAAQAARVETGWVQFDLRSGDGNTYVYPRPAIGSPGYVFSGNCQFNALVLVGPTDPRLHEMLMTAKEQRLRVSLWYDDTDGPMCNLAHLRIEWAD